MVELNVKKLRHYLASQLFGPRFDLQNAAARLGSGGGATTLKHHADPPLRPTGELLPTWRS